MAHNIIKFPTKYKMPKVLCAMSETSCWCTYISDMPIFYFNATDEEMN